MVEDNVTFQRQPSTLPEGTVVATDNIDGVEYQRMKLIHGADGVNDGDVAGSNPLPVAVKLVDEDGVDYAIKQTNNAPHITITSTDQLLIEVITILKKIEYHLAIATDTNLNDQDI